MTLKRVIVLPQVKPLHQGDSSLKCSFGSNATEYPLTSIVEALEAFQHFEPKVRAVAIALRASQLSVSQLHFYMIAIHAGLGVWS